MSEPYPSINERACAVVRAYRGDPNKAPLLVQAIEIAVREAIRDEREACAVVADEELRTHPNESRVGAAIRARGGGGEVSEPELTREQRHVLECAARLAADGLLYMPEDIGGHSRARALVRRGFLSNAGEGYNEETGRMGCAYRLKREGMAEAGEVTP